MVGLWRAVEHAELTSALFLGHPVSFLLPLCFSHAQHGDAEGDFEPASNANFANFDEMEFASANGSFGDAKVRTRLQLAQAACTGG